MSETICRICLEYAKDYIDIFDNKNLNIVKLIEEHLNGLQIDCNDNFSTSICFECWNILKDFDHFYRRVNNVQQAHKAAQENFNPKLLEAEVILEVSNDELEEQKLFSFNDQSRKINYFLSDIENETNENIVYDEIKRISNLNWYTDHKGIRLCQKLAHEIGDGEDLIRKHIKFDCGDCGHNVRDFSELRKHFIDFHGSNRRAYIRCCGRKFTCKERSYLKQHAFRHETSNITDPRERTTSFNKKPKEINHSIKRQETKNKSTLDDEFVRKHVKLNCGECGAKVKDFIGLKQHFAEHHGNKHRAYIRCCGRKFTPREGSYLKKHAYKQECSTEKVRVLEEERDELDIKKELISTSDIENLEETIENSEKYSNFAETILSRTPLKSHEEKDNDCVQDELIRKHIRFDCGCCGLNKKDFGELKQHFIKDHENERRAFIRCCGRKFTCYERSYLRQHALKHESLLPASVKENNTSLESTNNNNHKLRNDNVENDDATTDLSLDNRPFTLKKVSHDEALPVLSEPTTHKNEYNDDDLVKKHIEFNCGDCGHKVEDFSELRRHFADCHGNKHRAYIRCCGRKFTCRERSYLKQHAYRHEYPDEIKKRRSRKNSNDLQSDDIDV